MPAPLHVTVYSCPCHGSVHVARIQHCVWVPSRSMATECPEPLCQVQVLPAPGCPYGTPRRALPLLHRSYGLTRQSICLLTFSALAYTPGLRRLPPAPAGRWTFPTLSPQSLQRRLDPYPAVPLHCSYPFLPEGLRPLRMGNTFGTPSISCIAASAGPSFPGLQSFLHVQSPLFARPPDCSHRTSFEMGGRAVYTTH